MSKKRTDFWERVFAEKLSLICALVLVVCGIKFTWDLSHAIELALWDETAYMIRGLGIKNREGLIAELGPLYSLWYRLLNVFLHDNYALYFQNARIFALSLPVLVFLTMRSLGIRAILAFVISWFYLISFSNIYVWPRVNHFAVCIMLIGWLIGHSLWKRTQSWSLHLGVLSIAFLTASYARPEQFVGFGVLAFASIFIGIWEARPSASRSSGGMGKKVSLAVIGPALFAIVAAIFAVSRFGNPVASGGRGLGAFCQHFALNASKLGIFKGDPWMDCGAAIRESFGPIESMMGALISSPLHLAMHFGVNLARYIVKTFFMFFTHFNLLIPPTSFRASAAEGMIFLVVFAFSFWKWGRLSKERLLEFLLSQRIVFMTFFLMLIPTLISVIVIYPRDHYLLLQEVLMFLGLGIYVEAWMKSKQATVNSKKVSLIFCCVLLLTPSLTPPWYWARKSTVGQNSLLLALHQAPFKKGETLYVAQLDYGYQVFLSNLAEDEALPDFTKEPPEAYFARSKTNVMVLNSSILTQLSQRGLSSWRHFTVEPEGFGFQKIPTEDANFLLFSKSSVLDSH